MLLSYVSATTVKIGDFTLIILMQAPRFSGNYRGAYRFAMFVEISVTTGRTRIKVEMYVVDGGVGRRV